MYITKRDLFVLFVFQSIFHTSRYFKECFFIIHRGLHFYVRIMSNVCFEKAHDGTRRTGTLVLGWRYKV